MRFRELTESKDNSNFMQILADFLPVAMEEIGLDHLPKIKLVAEVPDTDQPTFGKYDHTNKVIWLAIRQRHPLDIIRTLGHEMVHYRQGVEDKLNADSGRTGSPEENEAHEVAGIVMRNFGKAHPQYFKSGAVELKENMDHSKDGQAVPELKAALLAHKEEITAADEDGVYDIIDKLMTRIAKSHGISGQKLHDMWVDKYKQIPDTWIMNESAAWHRKEGKSKTGGLNKKGVASYRREHPGSKLQTAVTTKPSKLKSGSKAAKRRKSFCARMGGVKGPMKKPNGKPTRKALALRKWNCESVEQMQQMILLGEQYITNLKENFADGKNPGRKGLAKRSGVNTKASVSSLRNTAKHSTGEKARMAHWLANMKAGKKKAQ
jgi:hypothetical protein